jgi:hypothetical protein
MAEKTDDTFSYEGDIQPMMNRYFNMAASSGASGPVQLSFLRDQRARLQNEEARSLELKARGMQFETTKLKLEEERRKSINARESIGALGQLQETLDVGLTQVPEDKRSNYIARVGVQFGGLIGSNDIAKSMFGAAQKGATTPKKDDKAEKLEDTIFKGLDNVKFGEDYLGNPTNAFDSAGSAGAVQRAIKLGTPEEQQKAAEMTPAEQLEAALAIRARRDAAILQGGQQQKTQGPRSLFTPQSPP